MKEQGNVIIVKILHLPLKAKWYKMQEIGEKTEEYREINPYWVKRLCMVEEGGQFTIKRFTHVLFRYGYTRRCFIHKIDDITIGLGNPEWGAPIGREVFIIKHHKEESPFIVGKEFKQ